jgi:TolA-binding protein
MIETISLLVAITSLIAALTAATAAVGALRKTNEGNKQVAEIQEQVETVQADTAAQHVKWNSRLDEFKQMVEELTMARGVAQGVAEERLRADQIVQAEQERVRRQVQQRDDEGHGC